MKKLLHLRFLSVLLLLLCGFGAALADGVATLPVDLSTSLDYSNLPDGFTQNGLGDYNSSAATRLKFDTSGDYLILHFDSDPKDVSFKIKMNGTPTTATNFTISESVDGITY